MYSELIGREIWKKEFFIGKLRIVFEWRSKKCWRGRFGGGWQYEVGVQVNRTLTCWIFTLLIFFIRIEWKH